MKTINNTGILFALLLVLLIPAGNSCLSQSVAPPPSPPPQKQELPPSDTTSPQTVIIVAPAETIDFNKATFEWTGSDDRTATSKLTYSYYLEGHDDSYSSFTSDTSKSYANLPDGSYTFYVKSHDEADNVDLTPASVKFTVAIPKPPEEKPPEPECSLLWLSGVWAVGST